MAQRTFHVGPRDAGQDLASWLKSRLRLPWPDLRRLVQKGNVQVNGTVCLDPSRRLRRGQRVDIRPAKARSEPRAQRSTRTREPGPSLDPASIRYLDKHIVVFDKPPGLTTMRHPDEAAEFGSRGRRFLPATAAD